MNIDGLTPHELRDGVIADHTCRAVLPEGLSTALAPLLEQIEQLTEQIKRYDRAVAAAPSRTCL